MNEHEVYVAIGAEGFERLVAAFYQQIPQDDVLSALYPAHDLAGAERRLREFLVYRLAVRRRTSRSAAIPGCA